MADPFNLTPTPSTTPSLTPSSTTPGLTPANTTTPSLTPPSSTGSSALTPPATPSLSSYMNPYTSKVLDSALTNLNQIGQQRRNQIGTEAFNSGAYGDGRNGVENALLDKDLSQSAGALTANTQSAAYDSAMNWMNTDINRQTSTAFNNANLNNQWFSNQLAAMNTGANLTNSALAASQNYANGELALDTYDKNYHQTVDNTAYQDFLNQNNWDANQLNQYLSQINGTPGQTSNVSTSTAPNNSWASMVGSSLGGLFPSQQIQPLQ